MKILVPLALVVAVPLSGSLTYELQTKSKSERRSVEISARVTADGAGRTRVEIVKSNSPLFRDGTIVLANADDIVVKVLDPAAKTWYEVDPDEVAIEAPQRAPRVRVQPGIGGFGGGEYGGRGGGMRGRGGFGGRGRGPGDRGYGGAAPALEGEPKIGSEDRGFETIDGRIVHYQRIEIVTEDKDSMFMRRDRIDIWTDEKLPAQARTFFDRALLRRGGRSEDQLDALVDAIKGMLVRIRRTRTVTMAQRTNETTQELNVKAIVDAPDARVDLAIPADFHEVPAPESAVTTAQTPRRDRPSTMFPRQLSPL